MHANSPVTRLRLEGKMVCCADGWIVTTMRIPPALLLWTAAWVQCRTMTDAARPHATTGPHTAGLKNHPVLLRWTAPQATLELCTDYWRLCRDRSGLLDFGEMEPLHATIEEFEADGFTHVECHCPRCRITRLKPIS